MFNQKKALDLQKFIFIKVEKANILIPCIKANLVLRQLSTAVRINSHNAYAQELPFRKAFTSKVASVEIDVFFKRQAH